MASVKNSTHSESIYTPVFSDQEEFMVYRTRQAFVIINYVILCSIIGVFGMVTNSINFIVFCKQGFTNTMTISFMALAISDQCCLVTLQWFNIFMNPLVVNSDIPFAAEEVHSLLAAWPHVSFGRITGWITAYITAERCLCITAPMAVRRIITPNRTTWTLIVIYLMNVVVLLPEYSTSFIGWKFYPDKNRTLLGLLVTSDSEAGEGIVFCLHAVLMLLGFLCVAVLTAVLVIKLKLASKWRHQASGGKNESEAMSKKDKKATRMVVMISSLLIVMYSPGIILSLVRFIEPKFGIFGKYQNLFMSTWSFAFLCNAINSSVNIFLYYTMSSKYRMTFNLLFSLSR